MDQLPALTIHVPVYVPYDLPVVHMTVGPKDGLSNGMVDATMMASAKVSQRGDARPADSLIDTSSHRREWLPSARMNRGPAGIREARSGRRLRERAVQHQSDRLDVW